MLFGSDERCLHFCVFAVVWEGFCLFFYVQNKCFDSMWLGKLLNLGFTLVRLPVTVLTWKLEEVTICCEVMMFMLSPMNLSSFSFHEATSQKEYIVQDFLLAVNSTKCLFCWEQCSLKHSRIRKENALLCYHCCVPNPEKERTLPQTLYSLFGIQPLYVIGNWISNQERKMKGE